jgi:energy-coupling factor transport system permease protein
MRSALAYTHRPGRLQDASPGPAIAFLLAPALIAFIFSNPIVLVGAGAAAVVAGLAAGARAAVALSLRLGATLGVLLVAVNVLVTHRGDTVLVRGFDVPVLGQLDVTLESLAAGGVLGLRIAVVMIAFGVYSACVDPDRVLAAVRPVAGRSALTATLISRMVPLASADHARLREAAALRGPAAAPVGRGALARRLVAGSLDRAVDVAATLELRGYGLGAPAPAERRRSRHDARFVAAAVAMVGVAIGVWLAGAAGFETYPTLSIDAGPATLCLAALLPILALVPFRAGGR